MCGVMLYGKVCFAVRDLEKFGNLVRGLRSDAVAKGYDLESCTSRNGDQEVKNGRGTHFFGICAYNLINNVVSLSINYEIKRTIYAYTKATTRQ